MPAAARPGPPPLPPTAVPRPLSTGVGRAPANKQAKPPKVPLVPLVLIAACMGLVAIFGVVSVLVPRISRPAEGDREIARRDELKPEADAIRRPAPEAQPDPMPPEPEPKPEPTSEPEPTAPRPPTAEERWKAFHARLAELGGRYPKESLDAEKPSEQSAFICEVDDIEFELTVSKHYFPEGPLTGHLTCERPDPAKRQWAITYEWWKDGSPKVRAPLARAYVENGWLFVDLPAKTEATFELAARRALTCGLLTLATPLLPGESPNEKSPDHKTFVQLRRPTEHGPIVIKKFFANTTIWPSGTAPVHFVPLPGVQMPATPWEFRLTSSKAELVLQGDGKRKPVGVRDTDNKPATPPTEEPCANQITWQVSFSTRSEPVTLARTDLEFQRANMIGLLDVRMGNVTYDPAIAHFDFLGNIADAAEEANVASAGKLFPLHPLKVARFNQEHLEKVHRMRLIKFIETLREALSRKGQKELIAITGSLSGEKKLTYRPLSEWRGELGKLLSKEDLYKEWCRPPGPQPDPLPAGEKDESRINDWKRREADWQTENAAYQDRLKEAWKKTAEFAQWLRDNKTSPEDEKIVAALRAVCDAIEKLPAIETGKRETLELLESMLDADLEITGQLVALHGEPCVLATFTKGREPVVIGSGDARSTDTARPDTAFPERPFRRP
jgi:hypothetical protein